MLSGFAPTPQVRAFDFRSGKLRRKYDESRRAMEDMIAKGQLKIDAMDLGKKSAVEKELEVMNRTIEEKRPKRKR